MPQPIGRSVVTVLNALGVRNIIRHKLAQDVSQMLDVERQTAALPQGGDERTSVISLSDSVVWVRVTDVEAPYEALFARGARQTCSTLRATEKAASAVRLSSPANIAVSGEDSLL